MENKSIEKRLTPKIQGTINVIISQMQSVNKDLRLFSKNISEKHLELINKLALQNNRISIQTLHETLLYLVEVTKSNKNNTFAISMILKIIDLFKMICELEQKSEVVFESANIEAQIQQNIKLIIQVLDLIIRRNRQQQIVLKVIQATYSLIDKRILTTMQYSLIGKLFSICFQCSFKETTIENISRCALYSLIQTIFQNNENQLCLQLLKQLLYLVIENKKCQWIKDECFKKICWSLIVKAIRCCSLSFIQHLGDNHQMRGLINKMYQLSIDIFLQNKLFDEKGEYFEQNLAWRSAKRPQIMQPIITENFLRSYKTFVYFSIHLSINIREELDQIVPFKLQIIKDLKFSSKKYLYLEGISLLLDKGSWIIIEDEYGLILLDFFSKSCEQIMNLKIPITVKMQEGDLYLEKLFCDFSKIGQSDFLKLIRKTIIKVRKNIEQYSKSNKLQQLSLNQSNISLSQDESLVNKSTNQSTNSKSVRWNRLIKVVCKIIRYLASVNMKTDSDDQIIRKFVIQLQYWFIVPCLLNRFVQQSKELYNLSHKIEIQLQAIRASQCVQIISNITHGYYDLLDSLGITLIMKIMAIVTLHKSQDKGFDELDEVCAMIDLLYQEQRIIKNSAEFKKTLQGFIQCVNLYLADISVPSDQKRNKNQIKGLSDRNQKLINYVLNKTYHVVVNNIDFSLENWNLLICFWISVAINKNLTLRNMIMNHSQRILHQLHKQKFINEEKLLLYFEEMTRLNLEMVGAHILKQIKLFLPNIENVNSFCFLFKLLNEQIFQKTKQLSEQTQDLQELIIKDYMFKIKDIQNICDILQNVSFNNNDKNNEYKKASLIWNISDHLRQLIKNQNLVINDEVWIMLFAKIISLAKITKNHQTRQVCIHQFTQILADSFPFLGKELYKSILINEFLILFYLMVGIQENENQFQPNIQIDMTKVGINYYAKLTKKCISNNQECVREIYQTTFQKFQHFLKQKKNKVTIQYLFQLALLIQFYKQSQPAFKQYNILFEKTKIVNIIEIMKNLNEQLKVSNKHLWQKKYSPLFIALEQFYKQQ